MFDTEFCKNRSRPLNFRRTRFFLFFFSWHQIIKIRCIHEDSSVRKPKSSNVLPQRNNFVKSVRKQYGNPDSHPFFNFTCTVWVRGCQPSFFNRPDFEKLDRREKSPENVSKWFLYFGIISIKHGLNFGKIRCIVSSIRVYKKTLTSQAVTVFCSLNWTNIYSTNLSSLFPHHSK